MKDAKGRPIEVGDWIATPSLHIVGGEIREGAVLGRVMEIAGGQVVLEDGDGIAHKSSEIITLGGYAWYVCLDCNTPSPIDVRAKTKPACPFCESERMVRDGHSQVRPYTVAELGL